MRRRRRRRAQHSKRSGALSMRSRPQPDVAPHTSAPESMQLSACNPLLPASASGGSAAAGRRWRSAAARPALSRPAAPGRGPLAGGLAQLAAGLELACRHSSAATPPTQPTQPNTADTVQQLPAAHALPSAGSGACRITCELKPTPGIIPPDHFWESG